MPPSLAAIDDITWNESDLETDRQTKPQNSFVVFFWRPRSQNYSELQVAVGISSLYRPTCLYLSLQT